MQILVGRLDSYMSLTHTKKYMTPIYALIFEKYVKMCVYLRHIKMSVKIDYTLEEYVQQKKVGWEVIFSKLGFAGSGVHKLQREFEGSALEPFFMLF